MLRRNGTVTKSTESVLRLKGSVWWERFLEEVGLELEVKREAGNGERPSTECINNNSNDNNTHFHPAAMT